MEPTNSREDRNYAAIDMVVKVILFLLLLTALLLLILALAG